MYKKILVPIALDHGPTTGQAVDIACALADEGGEIVALNVVEAIPSYVSQYLPEGQDEVNRKAVLSELKAEIGGIKSVSFDVVSGHAGRTIIDYAQEHDIDCIVIASHRPGIQDYFLGSTAARVVRHAACAVHVVR